MSRMRQLLQSGAASNSGAYYLHKKEPSSVSTLLLHAALQLPCRSGLANPPLRSLFDVQLAHAQSTRVGLE